MDAQAAATQRIAINPKNHQRVCRSLRVYEEVLQRAGAGRIDENSLHAFTLSIVAKGTPHSCLGAGLRALLMRGGAYNSAQIWWSRYFSLHVQAWTGSPFRKLNASRQ